MSMLLTIAGISALILLHEAGHFLVARACGMRVLRFSLGFGPALLQRRMGETIWQVAAIPLGGFVQVEGMGPVEEGEDGDDPRSFRNRPIWQRMAVIAAGPATNWLLAAAFITVLGFTVGFQQYDESQARIGELLADGAAAKAGLLPGDSVKRIGGEQTVDWRTLVAAVRKHPEEEVAFEIERDGQPMTIQVTPARSRDGDHGVIGVMPWATVLRFGLSEAIGAGWRGAWRLTERQVSLLWGLVRGSQEGKLAGLPGIVKMVSAQAERGINRLFEQLATLSIGLCLLNLVPIPAVDGGRLVFLFVELVRRKPINEHIEGFVHAIGWILLLGLMIFVSVRDLL